MRIPTPLAALFALPAGAGILAVALWAAPGPPPAASAAAADAGPVVLELFTSQGCSSCPSADHLLSRLADDPKLGPRIVPLAFHVDNWNYLGWRDPFSNHRWAERQESYARAMGSDRVYTPEMVVGGLKDCVGSQEGEVRKLLAQALATPSTGRVTLKVAAVAKEFVRVQLDATVERDAGKHNLDVMVALFESGMVTAVSKGENAGHRLANDFVVRRLETAFSLSPTVGAHHSGAVVLGIKEGWKHSSLGVAAFLQDQSTRAIRGATVVRSLPSPPSPPTPGTDSR